MNNGTIDIADLFYNYSLSSKDKLGQPRIEFNLTNDEKPKIMEPIASIEIEMTMFKCFTFFSNLDRSWRSIDANIRLRIKLDSNSYPLFYYPIPFALHSPNDLPHLISGKLKPVMSGDTYLFQYSQIKIERLGFGYDTDCREYGAGYDFDIRTDCIIECYQDNFHKICNTTGLPRSFYLIREEVLMKKVDRSVKHCPEINKYDKDIQINCSKKCKFDCQSKLYSSNIIKLAHADYEQTIILIEHSEMPDITVKYMAEISFISFVCNIGGLLGMWLGLSFYNSINELKIIANKFSTNNHSFKIVNICNKFKVFCSCSSCLGNLHKIDPS